MKMKLEVKAHHPLDISCRLPEHLQLRALILIQRHEESEEETERGKKNGLKRRGDKKRKETSINFRHPSHSSFVKAQ